MTSQRQKIFVALTIVFAIATLEASAASLDAGVLMQRRQALAAAPAAAPAAGKEAAAAKKEAAAAPAAGGGAGAGAAGGDAAAAGAEGGEKKEAAAKAAENEGTPVEYAKIAPFGKEDTSKELQDHAARTQDTLVDAVENAEVAEIKRAVFRALTRLRAASIKEFDTIARLETQSIDEYNDAHHYRTENPLAYLHDDEPGVGEDKYTSFH